MGPGTAVRDRVTDSEDVGKTCEDGHGGQNLNDVCFGCDGGCSDVLCDSKRSSQISADIDSISCELHSNDLEGSYQGHDLENCNMILEETEFSGDGVEQDSDKNGNSPLKRSPRSSMRAKQSPKSPKGRVGKKFKRLRSETEESPNKKAGGNPDLDLQEGVVVATDSSSEEEEDALGEMRSVHLNIHESLI